MKNFLRAIKIVFRQRLTIAGLITTSVCVAALWGGNFGIVYPFVEVVFKGKSLPVWNDENIAKSEHALAELQQHLASLQLQRERQTRDNTKQIARQIGLTENQIYLERAKVQQARWLKGWFDQYAPRGVYATLVALVGALFVATVFRLIFFLANLFMLEKLIQRTGFELRNLFYRRTLRLGVDEFDEAHTTTLMSRFTYDMDALTQGLHMLFGRAIGEPLKMAVCLAGAAYVSWRLLLLTLLITPLAAYLVSRLAGSIRRHNRRAMEHMSDLYAHLAESFQGIQEVKAFTMERRERRRFHETSRTYFNQSLRIALYSAMTKPITELIGVAMIAVGVMVGGYLVMNQETHVLGVRMTSEALTLGGLLLFYGCLVGVVDPGRKLGDVLGYIQRGVAAADRIFDMLDREPTIKSSGNPLDLPKPHRELSFEHVDFQYVEGQPILHDIQFSIPFGQSLAIVGPNGCGKSTLAKLILRFYDPAAGSVQLNGIDLRQLRVRDVRGRIGVVSQQSLLFDDTIMENIRYGSPLATDDEVIAAAKKAHAHQFILEKLEHGYQTQVGERGGRISGGQRQRIALARAILRDPEILLLDEATSQVDIESEQLIHRALQAFIRGRTSIMITHRLSTLALADRILVMDAGRIIDLGTHDELLGRCELYRNLHQIQLRQSA